MRKLLVVMPETTQYASHYTVTVANSFEQAKSILLQAEQTGSPFDELDLPVYDEESFWQFLGWMRSMGRNYPFSVFGYKNTFQFFKICREARNKGFHFNT